MGRRSRARAPGESISLPYQIPDLPAHLYGPERPRRILALDGGGVRGALSIAVLEKIEQLLRARHGGSPDFRLSHYYDLIGGTSTGAIIASALAAKGFSAAEIKTFYFSLAPKIFRKSGFGFLRPAFDGTILMAELKNVFGDTTIGDEAISTGLAIIAKRVDTSSTWIINNVPGGQFFHDPADGSYLGNKHYFLRNVIRASTAAPHYFEPQKIELLPPPNAQYGLFVDGGVTPHNNPAWQLLLLALLRPYGLGWNKGADQVLMTSIGTGSLIRNVNAREMAAWTQMKKTRDAVTSMISSAEEHVEMIMQLHSNPREPRKIDSEIGTLEGELLSEAPLLTYARYQTNLDKDYLKRDLGLSYSDKKMKRIRDMTKPSGMQYSYEIGQAIAEKYVREADFPAVFDLNESSRTTAAARHYA